MGKDKLSDELKNCLDNSGCIKCRHYEPDGVLSCRSLLQDAYDRIKAYENLEESGRLVKLPCKVGDTVYCVDPFCNGDDLQCPHRHYYCGRCSLRENNVHERKFSLHMVEDFDKTVFLTQEEAEAALKGMEEKYEND